MQRPSMRVDKREPISWASVGVIFLPRKPATRGASAASTAWREIASYSGTRISRLRNIRSVEYSAWRMLQCQSSWTNTSATGHSQCA
jgi:hypothetical protein